MPADGDTPRGRRALGKGRMEAFSDGVFGFAATLLGADLAIQPPSTLRHVLDAWPGYVAYVVSFLTIGAAWLAHTALTGRLARADPVIMEINLLVLLVVAFLPFPTRLVADALHEGAGAERVAVTVYGLTLLAIRILGAALAAYARHEHLYSPQGNGGEAEGPQRKLLPVVTGYVIAILIGLALPWLAVALYFGLAVYLIVPFREVARLLFRRP